MQDAIDSYRTPKNEIPLEEALEWFRFNHAHAVDRMPIGGNELQKAIQLRQPYWVAEEEEQKFRKGYAHGFNSAIEAIETLYCEKGYARPKEIIAILATFLNNQVATWVRQAVPDTQAGNALNPAPEFDFEAWSDIRKRIRERDGNQCVQCGSTLRLQVDHIVPVKRYGFPSDDNLQTLCGMCALKKLESD